MFPETTIFFFLGPRLSCVHCNYLAAWSVLYCNAA